jgi:hypothetical protein
MKYRVAFIPADYHTPRTMPVQPKICPADFRPVRAAGVFSGFRLPVKLPVNLAREQVLVTPSYPKLFE